MFFEHKKTRMMTLSCIFACAFMVVSASFRQGDEGAEVKKIQSGLKNKGYKIEADGVFGSGTDKAVRLFQAKKGLEVDGIVGPTTYRALLGKDMPAREAQVSRGEASTSKVRRLIATAHQYQGVPYVFGGTTPSGFDCSGYVRYVYSHIGVVLPRAADSQYSVGKSISKNNLQPGDLVFFETYTDGVSHSGIYLGNNEFISATSSSGVVVRSLHDDYWGSRYIGAKRVL